MKLKDVDLRQLLPEFMKNDQYDSLLASGMSNVFQRWAVDMQRVVIVGQTDYLNEAELDQLAHDQNIFWYNYFGTIEQKRLQIKEAPLIFNRLGTVWAVERVMNQYFENTELQEWFDYDGDPHYFKFTTEDTAILQADIQAFLAILDKVKRKSQWLEEICLILRAEGSLYPALGFVDITQETYHFDVIEEGE